MSLSAEKTGEVDPVKPVRVLAVITARSGSKGLPRKNIRRLCGKPLIAYSVEAGLQSTMLDRTIVSTDDREIADIVRRYGGETPFLRPAELATDEASIFPVLIHALQWLEANQGYCPEYVMLLQPTSPLRTVEDIDNSIRIALEKDADGVVSISETECHPYIAKRIADDGHLVDFIAQHIPTYRRQDLPPAYGVNGAIYLAKREVVMERQTFYTERTYPYLMPKGRSLDIDSAWDMKLAELILKESKESMEGDES